MRVYTRKKLDVFVISDATGFTAHRVISAVMSQFQKQISPRIRQFSNIKSEKSLKEILETAEKSEGVVIYSLVSPKLRQWMNSQKKDRHAVLIDLMGPLLKKVSNIFGVIPSHKPGFSEGLDQRSLNLADSIDFTLRHDDGANVNTIGKANVIILGVSRTSKTPTSIFLSCNHNLKVANVPIIIGLNPPQKLISLKRPLKVGLTIAPRKLSTLRQKRYNNSQISGYSDLVSIKREMAFCRAIYERIPKIAIIDVSDKSIEEVAGEIYDLKKHNMSSKPF